MNEQNMISLENRHQVLNLVRVLLFPTFCCLRSVLFDELILSSIHKLYSWAAGMGRHFMLSVIRREGDEITFSNPDLKGGDIIKTRLITLIKKEITISVHSIFQA